MPLRGACARDALQSIGASSLPNARENIGEGVVRAVDGLHRDVRLCGLRVQRKRRRRGVAAGGGAAGGVPADRERVRVPRIDHLVPVRPDAARLVPGWVIAAANMSVCGAGTDTQCLLCCA